MNYVTISTGQKVDFDGNGIGDVQLATIAQALSKICRFNGACRGFYSVAKHSRLCALAAANIYDKATARAVLLHDAREFVLGDIIAPLCREVVGFGRVKVSLDMVIERRFKVDFSLYHSQIKKIDHAMLYHEWCKIMPGNPEDHGIESPSVHIPNHVTAAIPIYAKYRPHEDASMFMELWEFLNE